MTKLIITLETLKALNRFASTDARRPHMQGVLFDGGRKLLAATDGHQLLVANPEQKLPAFKSFILPSEVIKNLKGGTKRRIAYALIDTEKQEISVFDYYRGVDDKFDFDGAVKACDTAIKYKPIDGTYPDYFRIIPDSKAYTSTLQRGPRPFNPALLGTLDGIAYPITLFLNEDPKSPTAFRCSKEDHFEGFGVIMPMRGDFTVDQVFPAWLGKEAKAEEAA